MHLGTVDVHVKAKLLTNSLDVLQTLLVVGTSTADPDLDLVLVEGSGDLPQSADDTLEGGSNVGEVGNTTTDEEDLAIGVNGSPEQEVENGTGVVVGLSLGGGTRVLTVVGELADESSGGNGIRVDDRSTTTGNESPDTTAGIEDSELERSTGLGIHVGDELLLLAHLTTERSGEIQGRASVDVDLVSLGSGGQAQVGRAAGNGPLGTTLELSGLVQLGGQVKEVNFGGGTLGVGDDNQGVDLEVGELGVHVDSVETRDEVDEDVVDTLGDLVQEGLGDFLVGGVVLQVDGNEQLFSLSVDITNVDTTLVGEEDPVTLHLLALDNLIPLYKRVTYLTNGVDVDVVFSLLRVRNEGLDEELTEDTSDGLNLDFLCSTSLNPFPSLSPGLVETKETALSTALDQLVGFGNELGAGSEEPRVGDLSLVKDILHSKVVGEVERGESGRRVVGGGGRERSRLDDGSASEVVVEDGLSVGLENGLSRHCELLDVVKIKKSRGV